jgi:hypothetical protein
VLANGFNWCHSSCHELASVLWVSTVCFRPLEPTTTDGFERSSPDRCQRSAMAYRLSAPKKVAALERSPGRVPVTLAVVRVRIGERKCTSLFGLEVGPQSLPCWACF